MKLVAFYAVAVLLALAPAIAWPATAPLIASKDNSIFASNVDNSNGGGAGIFIGTTNSTQMVRRGLLEFDIESTVPAGATVTEVKLTMYLGQASLASGTRTIDLHRLSPTAEWGEGTAGHTNPSITGTGTGFTASEGDATWNQRFYQQTNWTAPGAEGDYIPAISAGTDVGTALGTPYEWLSTPTLVSDVQGWLDLPSTNNGWIMIDHAENVQQTVKGFYSRNATLKNDQSGDPIPPDWRPTLEITYTAGASPTGDYNDNGVVDAADYIVWRKTLDASASPAGSGADGNQNHMIDDGDYTYWRARYGNPASGFGSGSTVPEPSVALAFLLTGPLAFRHKRR